MTKGEHSQYCKKCGIATKEPDDKGRCPNCKVKRPKTKRTHFHEPKTGGKTVCCLECSERTQEDWDEMRKVLAPKYKASSKHHADWNPKWGKMPKCKHLTD